MAEGWRLAWRFAGGAARTHRGRVAVSATLAAIATLLCCIGISVIQDFQHAESVASTRKLVDIPRGQASALVAPNDLTRLGGETIEVLWVQPRGSRASAAEGVGLPSLPSYGHYLVSPALDDLITDLHLEGLMPVDGVLPPSEVVAGQELYAVRTMHEAPTLDGFFRPQPVDGVGTHRIPPAAATRSTSFRRGNRLS